MLLGLVHSTSGTATINGQRYVDLAAPQSTVGAALEATNFHPGRSGRDHLRVLADAGSIPHTRVDELLELTGIPAAARKRAGEYSMGMRQRLGLAAALLGDPQVLVLDEPSNGLDPEGIRWLRGFLRHLSHEGKTILVSSHLLQEVEQTVDEVVIIANGRLVRAGAMSELHGTPGAVIRTSDRERLAGALRVADVTSAPGDDDTLVADTTDLRLVGDVALRAGLPIYGLEPKRADLEALFFELTEGTNRNELARGRAPRGGCRDRPGRSEPVIPAIRSEFRKFFTTRMWWGMAIAIFVAGGAFAALFAFVVHQGTTGGPGSTPIIGDDTQVANTVYTVRHQRRLPADADHRRDLDRLGVPAQDDQRHLPRDAPADPGDAGQGLRPHRHRRGLRPDQPGRVRRRRLRGPDPDRPAALPLARWSSARWPSACSCSASGR